MNPLIIISAALAIPLVLRKPKTSIGYLTSGAPNLEVNFGENNRFSLGMYKGREDMVLNHRALVHMLEALCQIDEDILRAHPNFPELYRSGVRYSLEWEKNGEDFADILTTKARGSGDCDDLSCWRVAELRVRGIAAEPFFVWRSEPRARGQLYHIQVRWPDGRIEDPSRRLGMK